MKVFNCASILALATVFALFNLSSAPSAAALPSAFRKKAAPVCQMTEAEFLNLPMVELSTFSPVTQQATPASAEKQETFVDELIQDEIAVSCFHDDICCNAGLFFAAVKTKATSKLKLLGHAVSDKHCMTVSKDTQQKLQRVRSAFENKTESAVSSVQH